MATKNKLTAKNKITVKEIKLENWFMCITMKEKGKWGLVNPKKGQKYALEVVKVKGDGIYFNLVLLK